MFSPFLMCRTICQIQTTRPMMMPSYSVSGLSEQMMYSPAEASRMTRLRLLPKQFFL